MFLNRTRELDYLNRRYARAGWDVHYAFFAKSIGTVMVNEIDAAQVHLFQPTDITQLK